MTTPPRSAVEQRTMQCDCRNALRPWRHDPECVHYRPLKKWADGELAVEADAIEARTRLARRAYARAKRRYQMATNYHVACLWRHNAASSRVDELQWLAAEVRRELARRDAAPKIAAPDGIDGNQSDGEVAR